ncbi:MAG TPA: class I tRNA ligase family protein [Trueperaceae bacterium]|nr:class I tRNA ligase family protein [Trueperaceae bacterium]
MRRAVNHAIKEVTEDMEAFRFNTAIAELMTLQNAMQKARAAGLAASGTWREGVEALLLLLAPIAPHITEELWRRLGHKESVHLQTWPTFDPAALVADTLTLAVQVNGKLRGQVEVSASADDASILAAAKAEPNVARYVGESQIVREIVVRGKLVNLVIKG